MSASALSTFSRSLSSAVAASLTAAEARAGGPLPAFSITINFGDNGAIGAATNVTAPIMSPVLAPVQTPAQAQPVIADDVAQPVIAAVPIIADVVAEELVEVAEEKIVRAEPPASPSPAALPPPTPAPAPAPAGPPLPPAHTVAEAAARSNAAAGIPRVLTEGARHSYPTWFLVSLVAAACEEVEAFVGGEDVCAGAGAGAGAGVGTGVGVGVGEGGGGVKTSDSVASAESAALLLSPTRAALPDNAPVPNVAAWTAAHSASLTSAWLWLLAAAADMRGTASIAAGWLEARAGRGAAENDENTLASPSVPEALDGAEITRIAAATLSAGEPFDGLVQEDFTLRLLRRLPLGHLSHAARIAVKAHIVRALLAAAGWGSINDATATLLQLHFEEEAAQAVGTATAAAAAARRGSIDAASPTAPPPLPATTTTHSAADSLAIAEAVLLEPIAIPSPASLVAFLPYGVDALGGALPAALGGHAYIITPQVVRAAMALVSSSGGLQGCSAPGARAGTLASPSSAFYSMPAGGPWASPGFLGALPPAPGGGGGATDSDPGRFALFGPAAWAALGYTAARSMDPKNCSLVLATPAEGLAAHFNFIRGALVTALTDLVPAASQAVPASPAAASAATPMSPTLFLSPMGRDDARDAALDVLTPAHVLAAIENAASVNTLPSGNGGSLASAAAHEIYSVIGRSLLREALAVENSSAQAPNVVPFVFVLLDAGGKSALKDPDSGAPLLLRSHAPLSKVEATLGLLARAGRRMLGATAAAAVQDGAYLQDLALDLQGHSGLPVSPVAPANPLSLSGIKSPRTPMGSPTPSGSRGALRSPCISNLKNNA